VDFSTIYQSKAPLSAFYYKKLNRHKNNMRLNHGRNTDVTYL